MLDAIATRILDILQADARLYRGGVWTGVERNSDTPTAGKVHLYDSNYEQDSSDVHPAIYVGTPHNSGSDEEEECAFAGGIVEWRLAKVPLLIVTSVAGDTTHAKHTARTQFNQLRANVCYILMDNMVDTAFNWWLMDRPGQRLGGDMRISSVQSSSGESGQGRVQCIGLLPVACHYKLIAGDTAI